MCSKIFTMPNEIEHLEETSWNALLPRIAAEIPELYGVAFCLHLAGCVEDLDAEQVREWLRELVRAGAI